MTDQQEPEEVRPITQEEWETQFVNDDMTEEERVEAMAALVEQENQEAPTEEE